MEENGKRIQALKTVVREVMKMVSIMDTGGIKIRFMNSLDDWRYNSINDVLEVDHIMSQVEFNGRFTKLGKALESKILEPLVFQKIASGTGLVKPVLITIITDGKVSFPPNPGIDCISYYRLMVDKLSASRVGRKDVTFETQF